MLLTIIGIAASSTSGIEQRIAGNEKFHKMAFYAAEAARAYVATSPEFYGADNVIPGGGLSFPNKDVPSDRVWLGQKQSFNGDVAYLGSSAPPRGSGTQAGAFRAHRYKMTCKGYGPANAESRIEEGFYRLGF